MSFPLINPFQQFLDTSGDPLVGGTIEFRDPTSNALIDSFPTADDAEAQTNANDNPLTLNASGAADGGLFLEDGVSYKVIIKDAVGATVATYDDVDCPIQWTIGEIVAAIWPISDDESNASVTPTSYAYPPGYIERYGGAADGVTDSTTALETAATVGRQFVKFYTVGQPTAYSDYDSPYNYYMLADAYIQGNGLRGPANFASFGTQTDSILRLGRQSNNSLQWATNAIQDIFFSGNLRADNCVTFGDDDDEPNNLTSAWSFVRCHFERPNIGIWKQFGNLGNSYYDCSFGSGNYYYHATGYPVQTTLSAGESNGDTVLAVVSSRDMNALDVVRVEMDDATVHLSTIVSVDSATQITIADAIDDDAAAGNYVKAYHPDDAIPVTLQHTGADRFYGGEISGAYKAAFYIDGQQVSGHGGHIFDGVIIESNAGFGIFVKDYNNAFNPMILRNVWFESNNSSANSYVEDADGIATSQTPGSASNFTLNGALISDGTYSVAPVNTSSRQLSFTSASDESGDTYTIYGTTEEDVTTTEAVTGPNATTVYSTNSWKTVTRIATDGAATGAITIGITGKVDLGDGAGPRTPRDIYLENHDHCIISGSQLRNIEIIDSYVEFDRCKVDYSNTEIHVNDVSSKSHIVLTNIQIVNWGDDATGASDVVIESIAGPLREASDTMRQWRAPPRERFLYTPPDSGTYVGGDTFESGEDLIDITASTDITPTIVDGHTFPTASRYALNVGNNQWQTGATASADSVTASKFVVVTQEMRLVAGELSNVAYIGGATWTPGAADTILNNNIGEWITLAWVGQTGTLSGVCRMRLSTPTGETGTIIDLGPNQVIEFDTEGEAIDYYNQRYLCTPVASAPLHQSAVTKFKAADENVTASTTLQDDNHLAGWSLATDKYYKVTGHLRYTQNVGNIAMTFTFTNTPAEYSMFYDAHSTATSAVDHYQTDETTAETFASLTDTEEVGMTITGFIQANATTGGTVDFQWAQETSSANNTTIREGSWITFERIG